MKRARGVLGALAGLALAAIAWGAVPSVRAPGAPATNATASPTSVVLGYYQCTRSEAAKVDAFMAEVQAPLMDALVREGLWLRWSYLTHRYGDEWYRVVVYEAPDLETHLRASAELTRRLAEAHPGLNPFVQYCDGHKDNLYARTLP
jgi:hypothetical protein